MTVIRDKYGVSMTQAEYAHVMQCLSHATPDEMRIMLVNTVVPDALDTLVRLTVETINASYPTSKRLKMAEAVSSDIMFAIERSLPDGDDE